MNVDARKFVAFDLLEVDVFRRIAHTDCSHSRTVWSSRVDDAVPSTASQQPGTSTALLVYFQALENCILVLCSQSVPRPSSVSPPRPPPDDNVGVRHDVKQRFFPEIVDTIPLVKA